jgi:hypothetical protein
VLEPGEVVFIFNGARIRIKNTAISFWVADIPGIDNIDIAQNHMIYYAFTHKHKLTYLNSEYSVQSIYPALIGQY